MLNSIVKNFIIAFLIVGLILVQTITIFADSEDLSSASGSASSYDIPTYGLSVNEYNPLDYEDTVRMELAKSILRAAASYPSPWNDVGNFYLDDYMLYSTEDLFAILNQIYTSLGSGSFSVYDYISAIFAELSSSSGSALSLRGLIELMQDKLSLISNHFSGNPVQIDQILATIRLNTSNIGLGLFKGVPFTDSDFVPLYDLVNSISDFVASDLKGQEDGDSTLYQIFSDSLNQIIDCYTKLNAISSNASGINTKLGNIDSTLDTISYTNVSSSYGFSGVKASPSQSFISRTPPTPITLGNSAFAYYTLPVSSGSVIDSLFRFAVPLRNSSYYPLENYDFKFYIEPSANSTELIQFYPEFYPILNNQGVTIVCFDTLSFSSSVRIVIEVSCSDNPITFYRNTSPTVSYLSSNDIEYYQILSAVSDNNSSEYLKRLAYMYADDEMIKQKEAASSTTNAALDSFSGSGSNAVSVGNISDASSISSGLSSGLDTGASVSDVFNHTFSGSYWLWFSEDNAQYFTLYSPTRKSNDFIDYNKIEWSDDIPDYLTELNSSVDKGLNGGSNDSR